MRHANAHSGLRLIVLAFSLSSCTEGDKTESQAAGVDYCQVVADYVSTEDCAAFQRQVKLQSNGEAAFNAPNPMKRGEVVTVVLAVADRPDPPRPAPTSDGDRDVVQSEAAQEDAKAVTPPNSPETADPLFGEEAPTPQELVAAMPGRVVRFDTVVGPRMAAELTGDAGFKITPVDNDAKHKILRTGPPYASALWKWNVEALRGGIHTLSVRTVVEAIDSKGAFYEMASTPAIFSFTVEVSPWQAFWDGVQDAPKKIDSLTAVITAIAAFVTAALGLWGLLRKRRKRLAAAGGSTAVAKKDCSGDQR